MTPSPVILQLCALSDDIERALAERGEVIAWHLLPAAEQQRWLTGRAADVSAIVTGGHVGCAVSLMEALPSLGLIAINGVGWDRVDLRAAQMHGVKVSNTPDVLTDDVADMAVGLIIGLLRDLPRADRFVRQGHWQSEAFPLGRKVTGRRFGIVGLGRIGNAIADRLAVFGDVAYTGRGPKTVRYRFEPDLVSLASASDVLVVACSATSDTRNIVGEAVLQALGPTGYLVNISRGSVVDEKALVRALEQKRIAGAALDVFASEPQVPDELIRFDNTVLTPHIASATAETRAAMADLVLANLDAFLAGRPLITEVSA